MSERPRFEMPQRHGSVLPPATMVGLATAAGAVLVLAYLSYGALVTRTELREQAMRTLEAIARTETVLSTLVDAETGQRGYLITHSGRYLEPFEASRKALPAALDDMAAAVSGSAQAQRVARLRELAEAKLAETVEAVEYEQQGKHDDALALIASDRGRALMERIRALTAEMLADERRAFIERDAAWQQAVETSTFVSLGGSAALLFLIGAAAVLISRDHRAQMLETWYRAGRSTIAAGLLSEPRLEKLGAKVLAIAAELLGARVGAIHLADAGGALRRFAGYGLEHGGADTPAGAERPPDGLAAEVARSGKGLRVERVPEGYLPVRSSLGAAAPRELLIAPAAADGKVQAVIELGFLRAVLPSDIELLDRASESIAAGVRAANDRARVDNLLEETQRQAEELAAQQEELRVSNEELEEQGRALRESRAQLEEQQTELEASNAHLEEKTHLLEAQAAELGRASRYKSEFLANMSHELRTPLNSSLILAKLLAENREKNLTEEQVRFAETIYASGNDLLALINDILDLSKIEAGKVELKVVPVDVEAVAASLRRTFEPVARQKKLALRIAVEKAAPARIETDAGRLEQVLKNLLSNALKFTEKGEVELAIAGAPGDRVAFAVRDTGIGIAREHQGAIFEAFRQADGTTHRRYGGTGLGLSISRDLAHLLGGDVEVDSAPGRGSTFTLVLPRVHAGPKPGAAGALSPPRAREGRLSAPPPRPRPAARTAPPPEGAAAEAPAEDGRRAILVIEDDPHFAEILTALAQERGFQGIQATTADEGIALAFERRPSAIVLDIGLPDHTGLSVLDRLKRAPETRHIPVHVVSASDQAVEALEMGAIGYALKPVKRDELVEAFQKLEGALEGRMKKVLVVEDDAVQRDAIARLLGDDEVRVRGVATAHEALDALAGETFDCMVMDLSLPDLSGFDLLDRMSREETAHPPVIVYTGRDVDPKDEERLRRSSRSIIIKGARSPERLLDEVTLFLHQVESKLSPERRRMLVEARDREAVFERKRILVVEDDIRNIFALTKVLEPRGAKVELARNGKEALAALERAEAEGGIDLVLMDIMMPEMDGYDAMREIRKRPEWAKLPIIALTAKAMKDDHDRCLEAGANDYVAKPIDVDKLVSLARVWIRK